MRGGGQAYALFQEQWEEGLAGYLGNLSSSSHQPHSATERSFVSVKRLKTYRSEC